MAVTRSTDAPRAGGKSGAAPTEGDPGGPGAPPTRGDSETPPTPRALKRFDGNRRKTAEALGISERTLYRKLKDIDEDL